MTIDKKVPQTPKALFSIPSKFANWLWQTSEFPKDMIAVCTLQYTEQVQLRYTLLMIWFRVLNKEGFLSPFLECCYVL